MCETEEKSDCNYFKQALSNEKFLNTVIENSPNDFHDWKTTIAFYSALHCLKSFANTKGITLDDHSETFNKLYSQDGNPPELKLDSKIVSYYRNLFRLAHDSRYKQYTKADVSGKIGKLRFKDANKYFTEIKECIVPELIKAKINTEMELV